MIKGGTTVEMEIYGALPVEAVSVSLPQDRYYETEQCTDEFEEDGQTFYVFTILPRYAPSVPCGLGIVVNSKDVIRLNDMNHKKSVGEI